MFKRLSTVLLILAVLAISPLVGAQQANQGQGLEISPPLADLKADPGQVVKVDLKIRNVTTQTLVVSSEVNDFTAGGEDGQPKLLLEEGEKSPFSVKDWISTIPQVTLKSGEQQPVSITLNVPANASPGGHYGVVRFTGTPPGLDGTGVSLSASIGQLILVNVSGDINESAKIAEIYVSHNNKRSSLFEYGPLTLTERIQNTGNIHIKPTGTIRVTNMFGKETASFSLNEKGGNVLPQSIRKFEQTLNKKLLFGRYTVQVDTVYGADNKIVTDSTTFWVIPYKLIAIAIGLIVLIIFLAKRYNRYIVKRAGKKSSKK